MQNRNSNIELPSNPQPSRLSQAQTPRFGQINHHNYIPQEDEELNAEPQRQQEQPQMPQSSGLEGKLEACIKKMCNVNLDKASKIASLLMTFFLILDFIPLTYFAIQEEKSYTEDIQGALEFMSANLMADPIMDLQIIDKKATCPLGFEALEFGVWNGTVTGCLCDNGDLHGTSCDKVDSEECKTIPAALPLEINERDGLIWCGKRAVLGTDYIKQAECPTQYKECYTGGCFLNECPITQVEIASTGDKTQQFSPTKEKYLLLARKQGEFPLINVHMTPNDIPCFNQKLYAGPREKNSFSSQLLALNESGCDKYGLDSHFSKQLDSQPIFDSYTQNTFRYSTMSLPDYDKYAKNATSVTSWRVRMMTEKNDHCLNLDKKLVEKSLKAFNRSFLSEKALSSSLAIHIVFFLALIIFGCFCREGFLDSWKFIASARVILTSLSCFLPLVIWASRRFDDAQAFKMMIKDFRQYDSLRCFGEGQSQGGMVISDYLGILRIGEMNFLMGFGLLISNGLVLLICTFYLLMQKMSPQENSNRSSSSRI